MTEVESLKLLMDQQYVSINNTLIDIKNNQTKYEIKIDKINEYITTAKVNDAVSEAIHYFNCPVNKEIKELDDRVEMYKKERDKMSADVDYFTRHPMSVFYAIAVIFVIVGISMITAWTGYKTLNTNIQVNKDNIEATAKSVKPMVDKERKSILKSNNEQFIP